MWDRMGGVHSDVKIPDSGDAVKIPQEFEQSGATYESFDVSWSAGTVNAYINNMWNEQGKPASKDYWAYIEVGEEKRYIIALAPVYGRTGDYVDLYVTNNGTETVYPCIIGDSKDIWVDNAYTYNGVVYGHVSGNKCNVVEVCASIPSSESYWSVMGGTGLLDKLKNVTQIANGGNIKDHPDGPVGLDGNYTYDDGTSSSGKSSKKSFLEETCSYFRDRWVDAETFLQNSIKNRNDATVLYDFKNLDDEDDNSQTGVAGSGDILKSCEEVTKTLLNRGCRYSLSEGLISGNIAKQFNESNRFCCATYVSSVLYHSGALTEEQINAYNYHWTGDGGIPDMLENAGWIQVPPSEAQPGDVVNHYTVHVMIYAGNGRVWDQTSCVVSSSGSAPTGTTIPYDISSCQIWRAP